MAGLADILAAGMMTPVGLSAETTAAAVRAGISRIRESDIQDKRFRSLRAGFLAEELLPPLTSDPRLPRTGLTARHRRMLRLATRALLQVIPDGEPAPLFLALPEPMRPTEAPIGDTFLAHLEVQLGREFDLRQSQVFQQGRAGGMVALASACQALRGGRISTALVGGVDTYLDLRRLTGLDQEERLLVDRATEGFLPGEGAAFLLLGAPGEARRQQRAPLAHILGVGTGTEEGHRYSDLPYRGDGLSQAFRQLFASDASSTPRIRHVYGSFNGEHFWAKEWGVSYVRHGRRFAEPLRVDHPVEFMGDTGAALGPLMSGLAAMGLAKGYHQGPILVWSSSDREARGAVLLGSRQEPGPTRAAILARSPHPTEHA
ncbi:hypothetical protein MYSTI_02688 [Myxococcus stipitatus DSM 14675]|uniref:Beta-ketoacyl synthase-like N-terminal domain-containing protein n=1 Tax=Myxococcus stipitatus (strain DSM 14675 / JCM 12634 / Mx s8) TaxID=1278073 RepID=L7UC19_MYXSD|nr:beta-ketoacyl synthase N-terminal-like domain-containing protein [Myxococcus stipitatus]AGC44004.1 hypothetical protein MYSTI_02688 [Myxococcus stipitatus DSM 14675]